MTFLKLDAGRCGTESPASLELRGILPTYPLPIDLIPSQGLFCPSDLPMEKNRAIIARFESLPDAAACFPLNPPD